MKIQTEIILEDLCERTRNIMNDVKKLEPLSLNELNWKINPESWSILECLEHLNLYGDFYLPEIESRISESKLKPETEFKSGFLGNYFAKSMLPKEKLNKMKTFKDKDPKGSKLDKSTIKRFIEQQKITLELLNKARTVSLNKTKTSVSISTLIKLRLGDVFRFLIYHNQRHFIQAFNVLKEYNSSR